MIYTTLISAAELNQHLGQPDWAVVDCRFTLTDPARGRRDYESAHIPGAVYAHVDEDLAGPITPGQTGRHPLPAVAIFAQTLSRWGIDASVQVVAYDDSGGSMAARLWWLLRWLGHEAVAVLDGGWPAWQSEGYSVRSGVEARGGRVFMPRPQPHLVAGAAEVLAVGRDPTYRLLDARSADRFRGENETIDPVAGHIPGAISAPFANNLTPDGRFRSPEALRARFQDLLGDVPPEKTIVYCGSGVTAAHNLLALAYAGLGEGRLYAGSWSEWITSPTRSIENPSEEKG
jgi:thiosulfate/3-mercaptopyruvate sulfurtransferase